MVRRQSLHRAQGLSSALTKFFPQEQEAVKSLPLPPLARVGTDRMLNLP